MRGTKRGGTRGPETKGPTDYRAGSRGSVTGSRDRSDAGGSPRRHEGARRDLKRGERGRIAPGDRPLRGSETVQPGPGCPRNTRKTRNGRPRGPAKSPDATPSGPPPRPRISAGTRPGRAAGTEERATKREEGGSREGAEPRRRAANPLRLSRRRSSKAGTPPRVPPPSSSRLRALAGGPAGRRRPACTASVRHEARGTEQEGREEREGNDVGGVGPIRAVPNAARRSARRSGEIDVVDESGFARCGK